MIPFARSCIFEAMYLFAFIFRLEQNSSSPELAKKRKSEVASYVIVFIRSYRIIATVISFSNRLLSLHASIKLFPCCSQQLGVGTKLTTSNCY